MSDSEKSESHDDGRLGTMPPRRVIGWICIAVVVVSLVSCVVMAGMRSEGLVQVTVTALDEAAEPRDHNIPLFKKKEALPDYQLIVNLKNGELVRLAVMPDKSAVDGLTWDLSEPVCLHDIASVRLQEKDKLISDAVTEVQITSDSVTKDNYRFDFSSKRSASVGIRSFFGTPIGSAIVAGFAIAVVLLLLSLFCI